MMISLISGIFLGWSLGANDASNAFGAAVTSKMLRFRTAAVLAAVCVLAGAMLEGQAGIETLRGLTRLAPHQAVVSSVAAAVTVTIMTLLGLPVSASQAVVGAIMGIGFINRQVNLAGLGKVIACWVGTPIGAVVIAVMVYKTAGAIYNRLDLNLFESDILLRLALIAAGAYGAYAIGANNVANVTAVFVGAGTLSVFSATLLGGVSIALGILTFSRRVMETVGKKIVRLDAFSALVVVLAEAITLHIYTVIGVPVSSSQAVIGAIVGVGIVKGIKTVSRQQILNILIAWLLTPTAATLIAILLEVATHLQYVPG
ncbi:MAG: inorganic phosphate transporter [Desulfobacterales bacterium]|nr:inorganic phosphate transporter [Desulfobacterales bacterium]MDD4072228.1 inorganic phosphate transporter [Desulfobacterales bacterium]MDD4393689.1 inorganic phosphate transporter [Desulfobacterales bacterium]